MAKSLVIDEERIQYEIGRIRICERQKKLTNLLALNIDCYDEFTKFFNERFEFLSKNRHISHVRKMAPKARLWRISNLRGDYRYVDHDRDGLTAYEAWQRCHAMNTPFSDVFIEQIVPYGG